MKQICLIFVERDKINIVECQFKGILKKGVHYIDGEVSFRSSPKFFINWCKFDDEYSGSLNIKMMEKTELKMQEEKGFHINVYSVVFVLLGLLVTTLIALLICTKTIVKIKKILTF